MGLLRFLDALVNCLEGICALGAGYFNSGGLGLSHDAYDNEDKDI
jgi:hypothetical protein